MKVWRICRDPASKAFVLTHYGFAMIVGHIEHLPRGMAVRSDKTPGARYYLNTTGSAVPDGHIECDGQTLAALVESRHADIRSTGARNGP